MYKKTNVSPNLPYLEGVIFACRILQDDHCCAIRGDSRNLRMHMAIRVVLLSTDVRKEEILYKYFIQLFFIL